MKATKKALKTVSYKAFCEERNRVTTELGIGWCGDWRIHLEDLGSDADTPEIKMGVDWPCLGAVDAETAQRFSDVLVKAAEAAANFKYNGCKFDWGKKGEVLVEVR